MPVKTTYICDRCAKSADNESDMWTVGLFCESYGQSRRYTSGHSGNSYPTRLALWCRGCVDETGVLRGQPLIAEESPTPRATLEDLVREFAREEIEAQGAQHNG